jgi:hypothetical protein
VPGPTRIPPAPPLPLWTPLIPIYSDFGGSLIADESVQPTYVSRCASSPNNSWLIRCDLGQIEVLPDDVLLAIFDFFMVRDQDFLRSGDQPPTLITTGTISNRTVEGPCFSITMSPESATLLYARISYKEVPGCLACLTSPHHER